MKLARIVQSPGAPPQLAVIDGGFAYPQPKVSKLDMRGAIGQWALQRDAIAGWVDSETPVPLSAVRLLSPIRRPGKIMAIGLNYADHLAEMGQSPPTSQTWFCKQPTAVNGPFDPIELPRVSSAVDYEVELVAVIGATCRNVSREEACDVIFGYCVGNDVSARDWQTRSSQWVMAKSFDTHAPFGPWITTADEVEDPHALDLWCEVNGERRQSSNTRRLVFDVFDQVAELSAVMTLEPGDLIFTGTPGGVGAAMSPPRFLRAGDRVRCAVEGLGHIEGVMVRAANA